METATKKRICIIGGGPRGLVTARHLQEIEDVEIVVFEAKEDIGGLWFFKNMEKKENPNEAEEDNFYRLYKCRQDSMYETLITNLPYFFMEFKDLGMRDLDKDIPLFISISQYKQYLDAYAEKFDLRRLIQFNTLLKSVRLYKNLSEEEKQKVKAPRHFVVKTVDTKGSSLEANEAYHNFDYVIVTTGQYSFPFIPIIPGSDKFEGNMIHYKNFGSPSAEMYRDKKVLIIGGSDAANDMLIQFFSSDIQRVQDCKKVILCSRKTTHIKKSDDFKRFIEQGKLSLHQGKVLEFKEGQIACFSDGTEEKVDTVIYATGYKLKFPYLEDEKGSLIDHDEEAHQGVFFGPLYQKFISIREPNLFFIGFLKTTLIVNILPELQAMAARYIIEGKLPIPSQEEMLKVYNEEVALHMKHIGNLAHFYNTDLTLNFPELTNNFEHNEWLFFSNWLKEIHRDNDEKKSEEFFDVIAKTKKALMKFKSEGNFLQYKKYDYHLIYPKEFRNTSEFV